MADRKHLLHVKSNVAETAEQYGIDKFLVTPKKPVDLLYGEIAVNYGKGVEALIIRNQENNVVAFVNENDFYEAGKIAAEGLATEKMEREQAFNYLVKKIDTSAVLSMVSITYAEIKVLREQSKLKAGQLYRITDYVTTTKQVNTRSAGHVFDVIVLATDADTLNENAKVIKHEGDTYFANSNLDAWEIKYDLDNDTTKYAWADETNGKGVIFYMKDELNNECPYDFKNIQFKRWAVTEVQNSKLDSNTLTLLRDIFVFNKDGNKFTTRFGYKGSDCKYGYTTHVVDATDSAWYYTFSTIKLESGRYALTNIEDASIKGNNFYNEFDGGGCLGNSIKPYYDNMASDHKGINGIQYLNNIVFNGYYDESVKGGTAYHCLSNSFGYNSLNNTFGNDCNYNSFGNLCSSNTFGNECNYNTFGNDCSGNTFGVKCLANSFGNGCSSNTFGNECNDNSFGNGCNDNSFGNSCKNNTFGEVCLGNTFGEVCLDNTFWNDCDSNTFGVKCLANTFGNNCSNNTFVDGCRSNTFGNVCAGNTFGNGCYSNTFGNECNDNSFGGDCCGNTFGNNIQQVKFNKDFMWYNIVESGNTYITVTSSETTSSSISLRNFTIAQGVNNATLEGQRKTISHNTTNDTFKTTYQNANSKTGNV